MLHRGSGNGYRWARFWVDIGVRVWCIGRSASMRSVCTVGSNAGVEVQAPIMLTPLRIGVRVRVRGGGVV